MNLIQCTENCIHQKDGYCSLEHTETISDPEGDCCYFINKNTNYKKI